MARTLYEAIDGERTVADILLHVHGSQYVVTKFLFELHRNGFVEIVGVKPTQPVGTAPAAPRPAEPPSAAPLPAPQAVDPPPADFPPVLDFVPPMVDTQPVEHAAPPPPTEPPAAASPASSSAAAASVPVGVELPPEPDSPDVQLESVEQSSAYSLSHRLEQARLLMSNAEFEPALELLDDLYREYPGDESLRRMTAEAEAAFAEKAYRYFLPPAKVPVLLRPLEELESENLTPTEFFLLSRIDGTWNLKSIIQVAPLREADCLRTLKRLRENGVIELRDAD
jgi:hypothetical protein